MRAVIDEFYIPKREITKALNGEQAHTVLLHFDPLVCVCEMTVRVRVRGLKFIYKFLWFRCFVMFCYIKILCVFLPETGNVIGETLISTFSSNVYTALSALAISAQGVQLALPGNGDPPPYTLMIVTDRVM